MKRVISMILVLILCLSFAACGCKHDWQPPSCLSAMVCTLCGETQGEASGHLWQEATCTQSRLCGICGETDADALGHLWEDATCETAQVCSRCAATQGDPLGHEDGPLQISSPDFIAGTGTCTVRCLRCDSILQSVDGALTTFHDGSQFLFSVEEFVLRLMDVGEAYDLSLFLTSDEEDVWVSYLYYSEDNYVVSQLMFLRDGESIKCTDPEQRFNALKIQLGVSCSALEIVFTDLGLVHALPLMLTLDPQMTAQQAAPLYTELLRKGEITVGNIRYSMELTEDASTVVMNIVPIPGQ